MTTFKRFFFVALALMLVLPVVANAQATATTTLIGTVLQTIPVGSDTFVQLDTNGDGVADVMLKLGSTDTVLDGKGQPVAASQVAAGASITVPTATKQARFGYFEVPDANTTSNATTTAPQTALGGTVVQTLKVGNDLIVFLDTNGDGVGDLELKLQPSDTILDANGQPLAVGSIQAGTQLSVPFYRYNSSNDVFEGKSETQNAQEESGQISNDNNGNESSESTNDSESVNDSNDSGNSNDNGSNDNGGNDNGGNDNGGNDNGGNDNGGNDNDNNGNDD